MIFVIFTIFCEIAMISLISLSIITHLQMNNMKGRNLIIVLTTICIPIFAYMTYTVLI